MTKPYIEVHVESITDIDDAEAFHVIWERFLAFVDVPILQPIAMLVAPTIHVNQATTATAPTYKIIQLSNNHLQ